MFDDMRPDLSIYGRDFMVTPNFERLARHSVVFDYSFCQVAVCNPSRDSLLTGLRPDSVGTYNFGHSYWPHLTLPMQLVRSGYNTAGIGKIYHWETSDKSHWSFDSWDNKWYDYQNEEWNFMNSSTMPDKLRPEEKFRDYEFTMRALKTWGQMLQSPKPFMLALGYKMPHLTLHVPHKYYELYKHKSEAWKLGKRELRFPPTVSEISYRCCADGDFKYMREDGALRYNKSLHVGDINMVLPSSMHDELMMGYAAGISFVDSLLGKLLDFMDAHGLWRNTTVVLTADHGMHNGEKGIWEKWTLFEEATRVPLLISHPQSPHQGKRYKYPVESIDVYATLNDILQLPVPREQVCKGMKCKALQGKSLAPVLFETPQVASSAGKAGLLDNLRQFFQQPPGHSKPTTSNSNQSSSGELVMLRHNFALSQAVRCASLSDLPKQRLHMLHHQQKPEGRKPVRRAIWNDCDLQKEDKSKLVLLGYAMRTPEYRYVAYFHFDFASQKPDLSRAPYEEELYDHKNESLADFTHRETFNLAVRSSYNATVLSLRSKLVAFVQTKIAFGDH
jgi:iduronate 2-sulfatase